MAEFFNGNQHNDVLHAQPDSAEAKARLVDELKRRGNAAFQIRSLPEADVLYSKAIEHAPDMVALYGNRSMTRLGMGKMEDALKDAEKAIQVDPTWAKGYYRKAMAELGLNRYEAAKTSFEQVLKLEPGNKSATAELSKLPAKKAEWETLQAKEAERKAEKEKAERETASSRIISKKVVASSEEKGQASAPSKSSKTKGEVDLSMRGYKVLPDGRKTTYFNRELTEEEKELLKDNKPKQVALSPEEVERMEREIAEKAGSAWNQGGTFEERIMTDWAQKRLREALVGVTVPVSIKDSDGDVVEESIKVVDLEDLEGDASITFTRGKKRYIFDFNFSAKWNISIDGKTISGTLFFPDVSGDVIVDDEDVEVELRWSERDRAGANESTIKETLMSKSQGGLLHALSHGIHSFAKDFRALN